MDVPEYLSAPDQHSDPVVARNYDQSVAGRFGADEVDPAVVLLAELAGAGPVVEFAVGTGRLALPLAATETQVFGIDLSEPMLAELAKKAGSERVVVATGDMTELQVCTDATLVYLVFNTIMNLRTQRQQVACFRNAAAHLAPGGRFLIEVLMPKLPPMAAGQSIVPFDVTPHHLGFDEYIDRVNQISISHHYFVSGDRVRIVSGAFRYVWPSELDLMAELAGMELESRWAGWQRNPFTDDSPAHVSVWRKQ